jgi:GNAT superfamily N-acetyltransferase
MTDPATPPAAPRPSRTPTFAAAAAATGVAARTVLQDVVQPAANAAYGITNRGVRRAGRHVGDVIDRAQKALAIPPWQQTQSVFLGFPTILNDEDCPPASLRVGRPRDFAPNAFIDFDMPLVGPMQAQCDDRTHAVVFVHDGKSVATYAINEILAVVPEMRDRGIGREIVAFAKTRYPHVPETRRTTRGQRLHIHAHELMVERAMARGEIIPVPVLRDYPILHRTEVYRATGARSPAR